MNQHYWLTFGIPIGAGLGTVVGILIGNIALGVAFGVGAGVALGSAIDLLAAPEVTISRLSSWRLDGSLNTTRGRVVLSQRLP